jgi:hypothetical protein
MAIASQIAGQLHGRTTYIVDEKLFDICGVAKKAAPGGTAESGELPFRFTRLLDAQEDQPTEDALRALGGAMAADDTNMVPDSEIPAGYTYIGQFIAHEMTHNATRYGNYGSLPQRLRLAVSPRIDLGSLYGDIASKQDEDEEKGAATLLPLGCTRATGSAPERFLMDLPRDGAGKAEIREPRNDANLGVAQVHVAVVRFHNAVVRWCRRNRPAPINMGEVKKIVIQHFQSLVLHDYLKRIVDVDIYKQVLDNGSVLFSRTAKDQSEPPAMPVEFALAAFRFGHSMVRPYYFEWNRHLHSPHLGQLLAYTHHAGGMSRNLDGDWIADWGRLLLLAGTARPPLLARRIDTRLNMAMKDLPDRLFDDPMPSNNLATRTLLWGRKVQLPSGQEAARQINARRASSAGPIAVLDPKQVMQGEDDAVRDILKDGAMLEATPLWFYILKEAEVQNGGNRLGQLGSVIVMETMHELLRRSRFSIIMEKGWRPQLPCLEPSCFSAGDLIAFAGEMEKCEGADTIS